MDRFSQLELRSLIEQSKGLCVSVSLPTHRVKEEAQQDPIRLKNLLRQVERKLADAGVERPAVKEMLDPALGLLENRLFWQYQEDGLALFLRPGFLRSFRLPLRLEERAVVADQFCLQPLFPLLNGDGEFYLLALSQKAARLYKGSRFHCDEVALKNVPAGLAEVTQHTEHQKLLQVHSGPRNAAGGKGMYYGHGDTSDLKRDALMEYFRVVNRGLREALGEDRGPLLLAGMESYHPLYREANTYPNLLDEGLVTNPDDVHPDELHRRAWGMVAPLFRQEEREAAAVYERLAGTGRTAPSIAAILPAAYHGRVESLFMPAGRALWGRFDPESGAVALADGSEPGCVDLLNLAAIYTYRQKGLVYAVDPDRIPGHEEIAAVLRY